MAKLIKLDQKKKTVTINQNIIDHKLIFEYFDKQSDSERDQLFLKALMIGVLGLTEDRFSAFLSKTSNELGTELESLKIIFDLNKELFYRTTGKGREAELDIFDNLSGYFNKVGYKDELLHTGEKSGSLPGNKTGDIVVFLDGRKDLKIAIESKFDKGKRLGEFSKRDPYTKGDTAISQLLESTVNREADTSIIVFDRSTIDAKLEDEINSVRFFEKIGFVCIIDYQRNDYNNLFLAYDLARDLIKGIKGSNEFDLGLFSLIVGRFLVDFDLFLSIREKLLDNIKSIKEIINIINKATLSIEFTKNIMARFLKDGELNKNSLLSFYTCDEIKEKFQVLEKEIEEIVRIETIN